MAEVPVILAFGDSLTWGQDARLGRRHRHEDRWSSRLETGLGGRARVIAEGLRGRTTAVDNHLAAADRNGARLLPTLLDTHWPLAVVIVMLGTNDLMSPSRWTALQASFGMRRLIQIVQAHASIAGDIIPKVLIVAPPHVEVSDSIELEEQYWREQQRAESHKLAMHYEVIAKQHGASFFDSASVARADKVDGVHLDAANTSAIGDALVGVVSQWLQ